MANNIAQFKTDLKTAITNNFDATTQTKIGNRYLSAFASEWAAFLAGGGTDTAANRRTFVVDHIFSHLNAIYQGESYKENMAAIPQPEVIS